MAKKSKKSRRAKLRRSCGAMAAHMALLEQYPSFRANQMRLEGATNRRRDARFDLRKAKIVTIKTVVNVVYNTAEQNISQAQINSQIKAMNKDFRATNPDKSGTPAPWLGLVTDSRIQFKLVKVTRTKTTQTGFTHDDRVKKASDRRHRARSSRTTHLNLWVCAAAPAACSATRSFPADRRQPTASSSTISAFGTIGTAQAPFHKGRTATHEIGHYFNLRHIWGDTPDCSGSDMVADTPNCAGPNTGMPTWPVRHLQQRPERRHVHELHGLHRRRRDVHVHVAAGAADARPRSRRCAPAA